MGLQNRHNVYFDKILFVLSSSHVETKSTHVHSMRRFDIKLSKLLEKYNFQ